jgi:putative ubiquitin-RnfH superfamily antitoxin RatB of RatAB toxin-antitoxin module
MIEVEVVHAAVARQVLLKVLVPKGTTVRGALLRSGIAEQFPELDLTNCAIGIFAKAVADPDSSEVQAGDRIEIYRPLLADPKEVRRLRAAKAAQAKAREQ